MMIEASLSREEEIAAQKIKAMALAHKEVPPELVAYSIGEHPVKRVADGLEFPGFEQPISLSSLVSLSNPELTFFAISQSIDLITSQVARAHAEQREKDNVIRRWNMRKNFVQEYYKYPHTRVQQKVRQQVRGILVEGARRQEIVNTYYKPR